MNWDASNAILQSAFHRYVSEISAHDDNKYHSAMERLVQHEWQESTLVYLKVCELIRGRMGGVSLAAKPWSLPDDNLPNEVVISGMIFSFSSDLSEDWEL